MIDHVESFPATKLRRARSLVSRPLSFYVAMSVLFPVYPVVKMRAISALTILGLVFSESPFVSNPAGPRQVIEETVYNVETGEAFTFLRGDSFVASNRMIRSSVFGCVGHPMLFMLNLHGAQLHPADRERIFSRRAAAIGLAKPVVAQGKPYRLSPESSFAKDPFAIDPEFRRELAAEGVEVVVLIVERPTDDFWPVLLYGHPNPCTDFQSAMGIGIRIIQELQNLHERAGFVHGKVIPNSVLMNKAGAVLFRDFERSVEIDVLGHEVNVPVERVFESMRDFVAPWELGDAEPLMLKNPTRKGDIYGALVMIDWMLSDRTMRGHPFDFVTSADMARWKTETQLMSWIHKIPSWLSPSTQDELRSSLISIWGLLLGGDDPTSLPDYDLIIMLLERCIDISGQTLAGQSSI